MVLLLAGFTGCAANGTPDAPESADGLDSTADIAADTLETVTAADADSSGTTDIAPETLDTFTPDALPPFESICAGRLHTCALSVAGGVWCWGGAEEGRLGGGQTYGYRSTPQAVSGLASGVSAIACGYDHTCALSVDGAVMCWGANDREQLGEGSDDRSSATPVSVALADVVALSAGEDFTCAVTAAGGVRCWGLNIRGSLGNGVTMTSTSAQPVEVGGFSNAVSVGLGRQHACVLTAEGAVWCWGGNADGQVGDGHSAGDAGDCICSAPYRAIGSGAATLAIGGDQSCAVMQSGGVMCWGNNEAGALGGGGYAGARTKVPTAVPGLSDVQALAAGFYRTCAIVGGGLRCAGSNTLGGLGEGTTTGPEACGTFPCSRSFVAVAETLDVRVVAVGWDHTCVVDGEGVAWCWGAGTYGELGDGAQLERETPVRVAGLSGITALAAGARSSCALDSVGRVWCWGDDAFAQLGDGHSRPAPTSFSASGTPVEVVGLDAPASAIAAASWNVCALSAGGSVSCWGANQVGQLGVDYEGPERCGYPDDSNAYWDVACSHNPIVVVPAGATQIAVGGSDHACARMASGAVTCWGNNGDGQLGRGQDSSSPGYRVGGSPPAEVMGLSGSARQVACGADFSCALTVAGGVECWGFNGMRQLGSQAAGSRSNVPVAVPGLSGVTAIAAGRQGACALTSDGVACWGAGLDAPTPITGIPPGAKGIASYDETVCVALASGASTCFELAYRTIASPMPEPFSTNTAAVVKGDEHTCTLAVDGTVACRGDARHGQLGEGTVGAGGVAVRVQP